MASIRIGLRGEARTTVTADKTAAAFGSGLVPVFATPAMVGLLEAAAVEVLAGRLDEGETTVGTWLGVSHLAATPIGEEVRAEAELVAIDGRQLRFAVRAFDEHELIGDGTHNRMIVSRERFLARVRAKSDPAFA
jgi:fluoroacetyl-CoA thioesterase